jgi:hypothetical protein
MKQTIREGNFATVYGVQRKTVNKDVIREKNEVKALCSFHFFTLFTRQCLQLCCSDAPSFHFFI